MPPVRTSSLTSLQPQMPGTTLRELNNNVASSYSLNDVGDCNSLRQSRDSLVGDSGRVSRSSSGLSRGGATATTATTAVNAGLVSPRADRRNRGTNPAQLPEMVKDIMATCFEAEARYPRSNTYLASRQPEVTAKMRSIVVDWLVDVAIKFRLHSETFFLAVDIMDRYLATTQTTRVQLQLVGITALLIASKHEEMFPPDIRECIRITANSYTRDDILRMERAVCAALKYRFVVPTTFVFAERLLQVTQADATVRSAAHFFLEQSAMDYNALGFTASSVANAAVFVAKAFVSGAAATTASCWTYDHQYYGRQTAEEVRVCAAPLLQFANDVSAARYQAVRRKYGSSKYQSVSALPLPAALPTA